MYKNVVAHTRSRSITVPNVGVFAGFSARYSNARLSFGYRADFFFDAMDAGINARHSDDMVFHGPFATISIGLVGKSKVSLTDIATPFELSGRRCRFVRRSPTSIRKILNPIP